jgi:hypothetical protein
MKQFAAAVIAARLMKQSAAALTEARQDKIIPAGRRPRPRGAGEQTGEN